MKAHPFINFLSIYLCWVLFLPQASALTFKSGETISSSNVADGVQVEAGPFFLIPNDVWLAYINDPKELKTC